MNSEQYMNNNIQENLIQFLDWKVFQLRERIVTMDSHQVNCEWVRTKTGSQYTWCICNIPTEKAEWLPGMDWTYDAVAAAALGFAVVAAAAVVAVAAAAVAAAALHYELLVMGSGELCTW